MKHGSPKQLRCLRCCCSYCRRHCATRPACCVFAHKALSSSPLCDATGMSCACAQGLIIIAIMQRNRHVVRLRTRACARGLIAVAIVRLDQHVMRLRTRPYRRRHCVTQPECRALAHGALLPLLLCNATSMSCACTRGLIVVAVVRRDWHVMHLRTRPYCRCRHGM